MHVTGMHACMHEGQLMYENGQALVLITCQQLLATDREVDHMVHAIAFACI